MYNRHEQPILIRHCQPNVHLRMEYDLAIDPAGVEPWVIAQRGGDQLEQQIGERQPRAQTPPRLLTPGDQPLSLDFAYQGEMRHAGPALRRALGHDPPDRTDRLSHLRVNIRYRSSSWQASDLNLPKRTQPIARGTRPTDIGGDHSAARAAPNHAPQINPAFRGQAARFGGGRHETRRDRRSS